MYSCVKMDKMEELKICKRCIQPSNRAGIFFNEDGVCGACLWEQERQTIDWNKRFNELLEIAKWAKTTTTSNYDCVIGVSGGKDSTKQALTARDRLGLRCLLVNYEPENITDIGRHNRENLRDLGFDMLTFRPNPKIMKKLIKRDFYTYLNPIRPTEFCLVACTYIISDKFDIPLIIQGENPGLTLGTSLTGLGTDSNCLKSNELQTISAGIKEYTEIEGIEERDLFFFHYDRKSLEKKNFRGIWANYFLKEWSSPGNAEFAKQHGMHERPEPFDPNSIGTYVKHVQLDADLTQVNQLLKYIKFGFGQCMDSACYDLRENKITREMAIDLVRKYDGKCSDSYIKKFCDYIEISQKEFWDIANKFRSSIWKKTESNEWYNTYWDLIENE